MDGQTGVRVVDLPRQRALLDWVRFLWIDVLFPGGTASATAIRWGALLVLLMLPALLLYPCLSFLLFEPDEGRYAEIAREMLVRGEWVVPYLQGEPYLDKPPLLYWLVVLAYRIFGISDAVARLVPALAVHGCILVSYLLSRFLIGERSAFWGALTLTLAPGFTSVGRLLVLDGVLTFFVTVSLLTGWLAVRRGTLERGWWYAMAVATGCGILTKGPIALLLLAPPLLGYCWLNGLYLASIWRHLLGLACILLAVNLPWYIAISLRLPEFPRYFLWEHNVVRFLSPFDHLEPVWYYAPLLLGGLLPVTLLAFPFLRYLLSGTEEVAHSRSAALGYLLLAGGWCVLFFSLSGCKLPTYILPAFPPLALAAGHFLVHTGWQQARATRPVLAGMIALLLGAHYLAVPWYARHRSPMAQPETLHAYCGDPNTPVVCYPRNCDSVAFYLGREDLRNFRSKETLELIRFLLEQPRTVILFTHRHSLAGLRSVLPRELRLTGETVLFGSARPGPDGQCHMAIVERLP